MNLPTLRSELFEKEVKTNLVYLSSSSSSTSQTALRRRISEHGVSVTSAVVVQQVGVDVLVGVVVATVTVTVLKKRPSWAWQDAATERRMIAKNIFGGLFCVECDSILCASPLK